MPRINNEQFYKSAIKKYGTTAKGVHWNSQNSQEIRFKTILKMLPNDLHNYTLADAGCGFGDFYIWMQNQDNIALDYIGLDSLDSMVEVASKNTSQKIIKADICKDKLVEADYYICSGAMNILDKFETHLFIQNCYNSSKYGFVFNILHGDKESKTYNYVTTEQIKTIAKYLKIKTVKINVGYLKNDITIAFFKEKYSNFFIS